MNGITYILGFLIDSDKLFDQLYNTVEWDNRMMARKTASYGVAYNYSQMDYPYREFLPELRLVTEKIQENLGFLPNNCLINYYPDGSSKMGFHSDQTDILENDTGIVIVSLGATRILRFRNIANKELLVDYALPAGSLIYMSQELQQHWVHAIPRVDAAGSRMSLTFRRIKSRLTD
ncbi:MAG: alpha-ketoglutarate-dependent dioxygenase AlkB [Chitinophagaceae bacterium]|nr:alpha-ketoglutarate-dependent dioxygenase AlkB [Chitinophagaceae bacterium]